MKPLRILVVSNRYPPQHVGGYELLTAQLANGLVQRGHQVAVIAADCPPPAAGATPETGPQVVRSLHFRWTPRPRFADLCSLRPMELRDRAALGSGIAAAAPDVILVANMIGLFPSLLTEVRRSGKPVCTYVSDHWLEGYGDGSADFWRLPSRNRIVTTGKRWLQGLMQSRSLALPGELPPLDFAFFASYALCDAAAERGLPVAAAPVIHSGIDIDFFTPVTRPERTPRRFLFVGRLHPNKGVWTLLDACEMLVRSGSASFTISIAGTGPPRIRREIERFVARARLVDKVRLLGAVPPAAMPRTYADHDVLVFPSIWQEPFSHTLMEAMSTGMAVISTTTGGSAEIVEDGTNAIAVPAGDANALAAAMRRLTVDEETMRTLGAQAAIQARERFSFTRMLDDVERLLQTAAARCDRDV